MKSIVLICAAVLACVTTVAQTAKKATRPPPKETRSIDVYSNTEFDPTVIQLPAGFKGHDIETLSSELEKGVPGQEKEEFESTEQWKERLRLAGAQPIIGNLRRASTYAFVLQRYTSFKDLKDEVAKVWGAVAEITETFGALIDVTNESADARMLSRSDTKEHPRCECQAGLQPTARTRDRMDLGRCRK